MFSAILALGVSVADFTVCEISIAQFALSYVPIVLGTVNITLAGSVIQMGSGSLGYKLDGSKLSTEEAKQRFTDGTFNFGLAFAATTTATTSMGLIYYTNYRFNQTPSSNGPRYEITWNNNIVGTQENIEGTNIPKSFTLKGMSVNGNNLWVHGNATKHMGEYVNSANGSPMVENELMLSFQDTIRQILPRVGLDENSFNLNGWEIGINGDTGVIFHALYR